MEEELEGDICEASAEHYRELGSGDTLWPVIHSRHFVFCSALLPRRCSTTLES